MASSRQPDPRRARGFWTSTAVFGFFMVAAGVPSPLYAEYAERWHFSTGLLTLVFAVYALALLAALLMLGDLSDAVGRRPVVFAAFALLVAGLGCFVAANSVVWLIGARMVQGFATGLLTAAASASMLDLEPDAHPGLAALANVVSAMAGQATGALLSGALVEYAPQPTRSVYVGLGAAALVLGALAYRAIPETVASRRAFTVRVRVAVPPAARAAFLAATPCFVATWALSSFYLSLGPSLALRLDGSHNRLVSVTAPVVLLAAATVSAIAARAREARPRMLGGCAVLTAGSVLTVWALAVRSAPIFYVSTAIAGLGFGTAFSGALEMLTAGTADDRAALVSAIYLVAYVSFSVPAVIAGVLSASVGLLATATGFIAVVAVLTAIALVATLRTSTSLRQGAPT